MTSRLAALRGLRTTPCGLLALVATAVALTAAAPAAARTLSSTSSFLAQGAGMGDRPSPAVRRVQRVLQHRGYDLGGPGVDGRFGPITDAAVRRLQRDRGLVADGVVGPRTRQALGLTATSRRTTAGPRRRPEGQAQARRRGRARPSTAPKPNTLSPAPARPPSTTPATAPATTPPAPAHATPHAGGEDAGFPWDVALLIVGFGSLAALAAVLTANVRRGGDRPAPAAAAPAGALPSGEPETSASAERDPGRATGSRRATAGAVATRSPVRHHGPPAASPSPGPHAGDAVIGYVTLGADEPAGHADDPARALAAAAAAAGWDLVDVVMDREGGYGLGRRGLRYALRQIAAGKARGLIVGELRALSPSAGDLGALLEWFRDAGAALVALDLGLDTSTPEGRRTAATLVTLGAWERERIAAHTPSRPTPPGERPELTRRIARMRATGMTLQAIADELNAERVPTLRGGALWRPTGVHAALSACRPVPRSARDELPPLRDVRS
jgi:peptidoglycan hydrolase-like protein with peptidoglycan-binding domain/DNA invertase Pin-like site-specific DNA recombinase